MSTTHFDPVSYFADALDIPLSKDRGLFDRPSYKVPKVWRREGIASQPPLISISSKVRYVRTALED